MFLPLKTHPGHWSAFGFRASWAAFGPWAPFGPSCLACWAAFGPLQVDFRCNLEAKWSPNALELPSKRSPSALQSPPDPQKYSKKPCFFIVFCTSAHMRAKCNMDFILGDCEALLGQVGAKLGQVGAKMGPSWAKLGPSWSQVERSWGQVEAKLGPGWAQVGTKLGHLAREPVFIVFFCCFGEALEP